MEGTSVDISNELEIIKKGIDRLCNVFGINSNENKSYQEFNKLIQNGGKITHYSGNVNDKLIDNNPNAKQIISILIPKDDDTIIQGVMNKPQGDDDKFDKLISIDNGNESVNGRVPLAVMQPTKPVTSSPNNKEEQVSNSDVKLAVVIQPPQPPPQPDNKLTP